MFHSISSRRLQHQYELSEMEELTSTRLPLAVDCSISSSYPSIYRGGSVDPDLRGSSRLTSIVCQADYWHLSPEELRFRDLDIQLEPPHSELSYKEERLRYYLDDGLTSDPQFGPPMPTPAFSVSSPVKPTSQDSESNYPGLGCLISPVVVDESATSTCSLCAARVDADVKGDEEVETTSEGSDSDTRPTSGTSSHSNTREKKKRKRISRRVRRLEKTVENLLSLALTELQDRTTIADGRKIVNSGMIDALSAALSGLSVVDHLDSTPGTEQNIEQLTLGQKQLVDQNSALKKEAGIAERKLLARNERIQNLEASPQDADRRLALQNQKFEAKMQAITDLLDQARALSGLSTVVDHPDSTPGTEQNIEQLTLIQQQLVDQHSALKNEVKIAEQKLLVRNERIQNLEALPQDADRRLALQNQKLEAQLQAVKDRLDQARAQTVATPSPLSFARAKNEDGGGKRASWFFQSR